MCLRLWRDSTYGSVVAWIGQSATVIEYHMTRYHTSDANI